MRTTLKEQIIEVLNGKEQMTSKEIIQKLPTAKSVSVLAQLSIHKDVFERVSRGIYKLKTDQETKTVEPAC